MPSNYLFFNILKLDKSNFTTMDSRSFRTFIADKIPIQEGMPSQIPFIDGVYNWESLPPDSKTIMPNCFEGDDIIIPDLLRNSDFINSKQVYVELHSDDPIILIDMQLYLDNWLDIFCDLGSLVVTDDFKYVIEYTDDEYYLMFCNFVLPPLPDGIKLPDLPEGLK